MAKEISRQAILETCQVVVVIEDDDGVLSKHTINLFEDEIDDNTRAVTGKRDVDVEAMINQHVDDAAALCDRRRTALERCKLGKCQASTDVGASPSPSGDAQALP